MAGRRGHRGIHQRRRHRDKHQGAVQRNSASAWVARWFMHPDVLVSTSRGRSRICAGWSCASCSGALPSAERRFSSASASSPSPEQRRGHHRTRVFETGTIEDVLSARRAAPWPSGCWKTTIARIWNCSRNSCKRRSSKTRARWSTKSISQPTLAGTEAEDFARRTRRRSVQNGFHSPPRARFRQTAFAAVP